jgi:glycosyltransferase involved in cell wall biosynthesis
VNELTQYRPRREYFEFGIRNFANHLDFVLTRITTFPTLLELMMAAEQMLTRLQSLPEFADLSAQVDRGKFDRALHWRANYLLTGYFWPEWAMYFAKPDSVVGAFFIRHHAYRVRIDDVEHYVSGLVAYRKLLQRKPVRVPMPNSAGTEPVCLNARLADVTVWFLNQNMALQRSGVENAALLRNQVFTRELQVQPVLLTCRYNPRLSESIQRLMAEGTLPPTQKYQSVYDFLQNAEHVPNVLNAGESILINPVFNTQAVANRRDVRVSDRHGHLLMYLVRNPDNDALEHINHFCNGVKFRKDHYDARGFLSRIQYLHETTTLPAYEHYLRPDGSLAIAKFYRCIEGKMVLQNIRLHNSKGDLLQSFSSEQALITHALIALLERQGGKHVLIVDKNRLLYKPAIAAQDHIHLNTPNHVAVVPIIHALHTQAASDIACSPTNSNFRDILHAIDHPDAIVTLTRQQKADIQARYGPGRVFSIGHSYETDLPATPFARRNRFRIVSMARYSSEKNQHLAIDAFAQVLQKYPQATLDFYGFAVAGEPLLAALNARIEALGLQGKVRLNGWADKPALHYESAGLSLLTSQGEAYSLAIMESLCHACPPVAFDVPYGPAHLIEHGQTGLLVPFGDIQALAASILSVLDNPAWHQRLSEQARANSARFRHAEHAHQWRALFSSVGILEEEASAS